LVNFLIKAPHIRLNFCICLLFLLIDISIAQERNTTEYPYGGDNSLERQTFKKANFRGARFDSDAKFWSATFKDSANFGHATFNGVAGFGGATFNSFANFKDATFDSTVIFTNAKFDNYVKFYKTKFDGDVSFIEAKFDGTAEFDNTNFDVDAIFTDAKFDGTAEFYNATFYGTADFKSAAFDSTANFEYATFNDYAEFFKATFNSDADFRFSTFNADANFEDATFDSLADFGRSTFNADAIFQKAVLKGEVDFHKTTFRKEIDFRQSNFDSVTVIYLEDIKFPEGELIFYWEQFKGKDSLRIKLTSPPADSKKDEHYTRIEIIYHKLRDNFIAQGDKSSADDVMYELDWQRDEILDEFDQHLYGIFFGYGYQPWRFLLFVVLPLIIIFAGVWYWFYYAILVFINPALFSKKSQDGNLKQKDKYLLKTKNIKSIKLQITDFSYVLNNMNRLTRYWHALFFSTSVLLGIRFKKEWTKELPDNILGRKSFIYFVTFEWALGIILFVVFALLVKGIRFSFIKDLLGF
jgi:hypothetical protein